MSVDMRRLLPRLCFSFHINQPNMMVTIPMSREARPNAILIVSSGEMSREFREGMVDEQCEFIKTRDVWVRRGWYVRKVL
jgi:hypothetical protein